MGVSEGSRRGQRDSNRPAPYEPAIDAYAQGLIDRLQANARDEEALQLLSAHYESHRDYPSLANLLEGWAGTLRDDRRAAAAFVAAGDAVLDGRLDKNRARVFYETAIDRHPESDDALNRLESLLRRLSDDTGHERVLSRMARALERRGAEPMRRADVHYRLGQLYEHRLRLPGKAINEYRTALNLDPQLVPAITAARAIYDAAGKHGAVADMYELEIATITDAEARHDLLIALATHQRDFLEELDAAVRAVRRALKAQPSRTGTLELLADLLASRAQRFDSEHPPAAEGEGVDSPDPAERAAADRWRAAELYFQLARRVPRGEAAPHLETCLALCSEHDKARRMLEELQGYRSTSPGELGVPLEQPVDAYLSQVEVDDRNTGRFAPAGEEEVTQPRAARPAGAALEDSGDVTDWLDDDAVELIDEAVSPDAMVPVTERPPPPASDRPPRLSPPPPPPIPGRPAPFRR